MMLLGEIITLNELTRLVNALHLYYYEWRDTESKIVIRTRVGKEGRVVQLTYCDEYEDAVEFLGGEYARLRPLV